MKKTKAHLIKDQIDNLRKELAQLQKKCKHKRGIFYYSRYHCDHGKPHNTETHFMNVFCPTCLVTLSFERELYPEDYQKAPELYKEVSQKEWMIEANKYRL